MVPEFEPLRDFVKMEPSAHMHSAAVVTCVESGSLEDQAVRMIQSLRLWGGRLATVPVFAVKARAGSPLKSSIVKELQRLDVTTLHVNAKKYTPYDWYGLASKPVALLEVEKRTSAQTIIWLDGDTLVVKEPIALLLNDNTDFAAIAVEKSIGTTGESDPFEPFWAKMGNSLGVSLDDIGWVVTAAGQAPNPVVLQQRGNGIQEWLRFCRGVPACGQSGDGRTLCDSTNWLLPARTINTWLRAGKKKAALDRPRSIL